ncbi:MAG TPA: HAMP domain-containing sensor histidine kinase [Blastocatellia bacterium]
MDDISICQAILNQEAFAVFEFLGNGAFRLIGEPPEFCRDLMGEDATPAGEVRLGDRFPFLESFLVDAQAIWDSCTGSSAQSGFWIERAPGGRELGLEATALCASRRPILLIQNPQERYDRQVQLMQAARNAALEHERFQREIQKKEILLHCIVHDLSQPLTSMRGTLGLLERQDLSPRLKRAVETALAESARQDQMIKGILTAFSDDLALQSERARDIAKAPDLAQCAKKTVEAFRDAFIGHGALIELDPELNLSVSWRVAGEESRLLRVYGNLVENALRHSSRTCLVTLGVTDEGQWLKGYVNDQGPGISGEQIPQLFTLFGKGPDDLGGKVGLGLYFCKITIERWGGTLGCEMLPTGGAHFWFRLPRG